MAFKEKYPFRSNIVINKEIIDIRPQALFRLPHAT